MKRLEITLTLYIDEIGKVSVGPVAFVYRGCKDESIFAGTETEVVTTAEVIPPTMKLATTPGQATLTALAKLGFSDDEARAIAETISEKRIADVAHWVANKTGVGSPKKLAEKLFALG